MVARLFEMSRRICFEDFAPALRGRGNLMVMSLFRALKFVSCFQKPLEKISIKISVPGGSAVIDINTPF